MKKEVVIVGAGGHGRVIADTVIASGDTLIGFLDDSSNIPTMGKVDDWVNFRDCEFVVGIGNSAVREKIVEKMNVKWYTAIHPSAVISPGAIIEKGTVVMPKAVINSGAYIGAHSIVNTGAIVEHDDTVGSFCHVSVGAKLGGTVSIGDRTWIGIGATVSNNVSICENCMIGAGSVVVKDIGIPGTYIGVPAKKK